MPPPPSHVHVRVSPVLPLANVDPRLTTVPQCFGLNALADIAEATHGRTKFNKIRTQLIDVALDVLARGPFLNGPFDVSIVSLGKHAFHWALIFLETPRTNYPTIPNLGIAHV